MPLNQDVGKGRKHAYMEVSSRAAQEAKAEERKLCRTNICHTYCTFAACVFPTQAAYSTSMYIKKTGAEAPVVT